MTEKELNTEQKILDAAKEVFQKKGMTGTRMQEIADKAGINKALLHYYYRSKEKLFRRVFEIAFALFIPRIKEMLFSDKPILEKIDYFVDSYIELLQKHPYIPGFIINELNRNPEILVDIVEKNILIKQDHLIDNLEGQINQGIERGQIKPVEVRNLLINILALCVFPVVARPVVQGILFDNDPEGYERFLAQRKDFVKEFVKNAIKP
ncbi:MAG: TetR/AcrR family transcriptional regulator [Bacteroidales bacterium]|jgi:AcrR family transcriptional regulator|nr:TetR/AcrR family transcriptional regulator [Bacteroidales bacterium]